MNKLLIAAFLLLSLQVTMAKPVGEFAVANRGGSLTFLEYMEARNLVIQGDLLGTQVIEPMYVSPLGTFKGKRLLAYADRSRNLFSVVDAKTKEILSQIELARGAFHQFSHPLVGRRVAVATDIDKGMDIIEVFKNGTELKRRHFSTPEELNSGNPHDVVMDRRFAYLTVKGIVGDEGKFDMLLQICLKSLKIVNSKKFSEDIHLFNPVRAKYFVVVEQQTGYLHLIQQKTLKTLAKLKVAEGIHGISGSENGRYLFTLDINEQPGSPAVYALKVKGRGLEILDSVALNFPVAHNIAVDDRGPEFALVVTHSGGSQTHNSVLKFSKKAKKLILEKDLSTGVNPFGLTFY